MSSETIGWIVGLLSLLAGLLVVLPTIGGFLTSVPQLFLTEFPWVAALIGAASIVYGLAEPRAWPALIPGFFGILFAVQPIFQAHDAIADLGKSMRASLGDDHLKTLPEPVKARLPKRHWSILSAINPALYVGVRGVKVTKNVEFAAMPERTLKLDIYQPPKSIRGPYPSIIVVHGGSWNWYDKGGISAPHSSYLASQGYVVFDVQYRFSQEAIWPAQLQDVQCAIAWVKQHAAEYDLIPTRVALLGRSAGAHIALNAAYRANDRSVDLTPVTSKDVDTSVSAVVAIYPPTDLRLWASLPYKEDSHTNVVAALVGGAITAGSNTWAKASPTWYVKDGLPPTLIVQGYMDKIVPPTHAEFLYNLLRATDSTAVLLRLPWSRHGFDLVRGSMGAQIVQYEMDRFLAWSVYGQQKAF